LDKYNNQCKKKGKINISHHFFGVGIGFGLMGFFFSLFGMLVRLLTL